MLPKLKKKYFNEVYRLGFKYSEVKFKSNRINLPHQSFLFIPLMSGLKGGGIALPLNYPKKNLYQKLVLQFSLRQLILSLYPQCFLPVF